MSFLPLIGRLLEERGRLLKRMAKEFDNQALCSYIEYMPANVRLLLSTFMLYIPKRCLTIIKKVKIVLP